MKPTFLTIITGIILSILTLVLWNRTNQQSINHFNSEMGHFVDNLASEFKVNFTNIVAAQIRIASRWEISKGTPKNEFEADAQNYVNDHQEFQAIEWVDSEGVVKWIVPLNGNEKVVGWDNKKDKKRWSLLEKAKNKNTLVFSEPIDLIQGGKGLLAFAPIIYNNTFDGYILGVYKINKLAKVLLEGSFEKESSNIQLIYNGKPVFQSRPEITNSLNIKLSSQKNIFGQNWEIRVIPSNEMIKSNESPLPMTVLIFGIILSIAISGVIFFGMDTFYKSRILSKSKSELEIIVDQRTQELINSKINLEKEVLERTKELENKMDELKVFNEVMLGREERVVELKQEVNKLSKEMGREPPYGKFDFADISKIEK